MFDSTPPQPPTLDPDAALAVLDGIGTRIIAYRSSFAVTTPVEPTEEMIDALAALQMDLPLLLIKSTPNAEYHYEVLHPKWLGEYRLGGWPAISRIVRTNILCIA